MCQLHTVEPLEVWIHLRGFNSLANLDQVNMLETMDVPEMMDEAIIIISSESDDEQSAPSRSTTKAFTHTKCPPSSSLESRFVIL